MTINALLVLQKAVRARLSELTALKNAVSVKETYFGAKDKTVEPQYDVKLVDKKCVELERFLFLSDAAIKQSNAVVNIEIEPNLDSLLAPLE